MGKSGCAETRTVFNYDTQANTFENKCKRTLCIFFLNNKNLPSGGDHSKNVTSLPNNK